MLNKTSSTPRPGQASCVAQRLLSLVSLSERENALLNQLESQPARISKGECVQPIEADCPPLLVVRSGWLISERTTSAGYRDVIRTHHPGDIVGFTSLAYRNANCQTLAKSDATVCPLSRSNLGRLFDKSPRLGAIFLSMSLIEQAMQEDRALVSGRRMAEGKLALFILQTIEKLCLLHNHSDDRFFCPLSQSDIGDLVGLSNVHVSRTFKKLEDADCIERIRSFIHILDPGKLARLAQYKNRLTNYDFSWLPDTQPEPPLIEAG